MACPCLPHIHWCLQVKSNCLSTPMLLVLHSLTFLYWVATVIVDVAIGGCRHCDRQQQQLLHSSST